MHYPDRHFNDYPGYVDFSKHMAEVGSVTRSNFLYPLLVLVLHSILPFIGWTGAMLTVVLAAFVVTTWVVLWLFHLRFPELSFVKLLLITFAIQLLGPISLPIAIVNKHLYYGFLVPNLYHNASFILVKPLVLLHFILLSRALQNARNSWSMWLGLIVLLLLSAVAKPNYLLCIVPASVVWYWFIRRQSEVNLKVLVLGLVIPGVVILIGQYLFTYYYGSVDTEHSSIVLAPFAALATHSTFLIWKFLLSTAFPLALLFFYWRSATNNNQLVGAWLLMIVGCGFAYLFAEDGARLSHMNFIWGAHIAAFVLFVYSVLALLQLWKDGGSHTWKYYSIVVLLAAHVLNGILWYAAETVSTAHYW